MKPEVAPVLARELEAIEAAEPFDVPTLEASLRELIEGEGLSLGKALQPIRVAITGTTISPGIFESLAALGRERSSQRIRRALERLGEADSAVLSDQG
jgi:glutamyl-tRNA synthetase